MNPIELIANTRSGIAQVSLEINRERIGFGSAFLVDGGLVTNSHVIRSPNLDAIVLRFADTDPGDPASYIRLLPETCFSFIAAESPTSEKDYVYLKLSEPEFDGRHIFEFTDSSTLSIGERIVFLGFPFGMPQLTSHIGYISSIHEKNGVEIVQIDGSVNGGNSGGPLLDLKTGEVAGIITRAVTGMIEEQFNQLIKALKNNQAVLEAVTRTGGMKIKGIDPLRAISASQAAMEQIAWNLHRSANVGIGYAYSAKYVQDHIARVS